MIFVNLAIGEVTLRTKGIHHLPGLAEKYLGKKGKRLMFFSFAFGVYSALLAYLIGDGESLSVIFFGSGEYRVYLSVVDKNGNVMVDVSGNSLEDFSRFSVI